MRCQAIWCLKAAWHVVPTSDTEMSMYNVNGDHYVIRTDGFISVHAGAEEGEFITKPFTPEQIVQAIRRMLALGTDGRDPS